MRKNKAVRVKIKEMKKAMTLRCLNADHKEGKYFRVMKQKNQILL
jgi:hypothetical protein